MKLAFCSISALDRPLADAALLAAKAGLDGLEVTARPPHLDPEAGPASAREAGRVVRGQGVEVIAYGSYLGRFGRVTPEQARQDVEIAAALETRLLRIWAEPIEDETRDPKSIVALCRAACDAAQSHGITVVVERHIGSWADTPERCERLLDAVDRPNLALNYQVLDLIWPREFDAQPADAARLIPLARYFHLKNFRPNPDDTGPALPMGPLENGVLDYRAILEAALQAGYSGPFTIEFLAMDARPVEEKLAADAAFARRVLAELTSR